MEKIPKPSHTSLNVNPRLSKYEAKEPDPQSKTKTKNHYSYIHLICSPKLHLPSRCTFSEDIIPKQPSGKPEKKCPPACPQITPRTLAHKKHKSFCKESDATEAAEHTACTLREAIPESEAFWVPGSSYTRITTMSLDENHLLRQMTLSF